MSRSERSGLHTQSGAWPELVLATANPGKALEFREILQGLPVHWRALDPAWASQLPAEGADYTANARAKALAVARASGHLALADDSGLEVDALGGEPGPYSARYGGPDLTSRERVQRLLQALTAISSARRGARFVCVAALGAPDGSVVSARGDCPGRILEAPRGGAGFGYDPIFAPADGEHSMAQLDTRAKHARSHRGHALRALQPTLSTWLRAQARGEAERAQ